MSMFLYLLQVLMGSALFFVGLFTFTAYLLGYAPENTSFAAVLFVLGGLISITEARK